MTWSTLHDLCAHRPTPFDTAAIIKHAREAPEEIVCVDDRGYTPLHIAVTLRFDPPLEAIEALVDLFPIAVMAKVSMPSILFGMYLQTINDKFYIRCADSFLGRPRICMVIRQCI
jgi:hypothetical protein